MPIFVSVTWPPERLALVPRVTVAFVTVNFVLIVAAGTAAHTSSVKDKLDTVRFISLLESSTRKTLKFSRKSPPGSAAVSPYGGLTQCADFKSLHPAPVSVY